VLHVVLSVLFLRKGSKLTRGTQQYRYGLAAGDRRGTFVDCVDTLRLTTSEHLKNKFSVKDGSKSSGRMEFIPVVWEGSLEGKRDIIRYALLHSSACTLLC
jgi:hypothetical protein